jgi:hypothetical protein
MNNVLAKKENANTTLLTWSNTYLRAGLLTIDRLALSC